MNLVIDERAYRNLKKMLEQLPEDFQRQDATMAIARAASKPLLSIGRSMLQVGVPNLAQHGSRLHFNSKKSRDGLVMRTGLQNKDKGRLGHLFNYGTAQRRNYSRGNRPTGRIDNAKFGGGWWDKAVSMAEPQIESELQRAAPRVIGRYVRKYMSR